MWIWPPIFLLKIMSIETLHHVPFSSARKNKYLCGCERIQRHCLSESVTSQSNANVCENLIAAHPQADIFPPKSPVWWNFSNLGRKFRSTSIVRSSKSLVMKLGPFACFLGIDLKWEFLDVLESSELTFNKNLSSCFSTCWSFYMNGNVLSYKMSVLFIL